MKLQFPLALLAALAFANLCGSPLLAADSDSGCTCYRGLRNPQPANAVATGRSILRPMALP